MDNIISSSIRHLKIKSYHFPDGWVEECIKWLFQEHNDNINEMSNEKWCDLIAEQWLFTDLRDFNTPSLLNNVNLNFMKFDGVACFQIMTFKNVSKSYYSQIRELKGTVNENALVSAENIFTTKTSSTRTLMLTLTDGINEISGFEFEPWDHIKENKIAFGSKCCLKGQFIIRQRMAFLKQANITLLGGEVEELSTTSQLSIVEDQLQKNISKTKNPISKTKSNVKANPILFDQQSVRSSSNNIVPPSVIKSEIKNCSSPVVVIQSKNNINVLETKNTNSINQNPITSNEADFDPLDDDDEIFMNLSMDDLLEESVNQSKTKVVESSVKQEDLSNTKIAAFSDKSFIQIIDIFHELSLPEASDIEIKQFKIRGMIIKFNTKLVISTDDDSSTPRWNLEVLLGDGTATVNCLLDDKLIADRIGFSARQFEEMKRLKQAHKCKDSINKFQDSIRNCNFGMFTLLLSDKYNKLCVVDHVPLDPESVKDLQERISQTVHGSP